MIKNGLKKARQVGSVLLLIGMFMLFGKVLINGGMSAGPRIEFVGLPYEIQQVIEKDDVKTFIDMLNKQPRLAKLAYVDNNGRSLSGADLYSHVLIANAEQCARALFPHVHAPNRIYSEQRTLLQYLALTKFTTDTKIEIAEILINKGATNISTRLFGHEMLPSQSAIDLAIEQGDQVFAEALKGLFEKQTSTGSRAAQHPD